MPRHEEQKWFDEHDRIAVLQDGRLIAMGKFYELYDAAAAFSDGCEEFNVRVPDLRMIEYVLNVQMHISPVLCGEPVYEAVNKKITGNVVGMTLLGANQSQAAGTTLTIEVIAIGPP